MKRTRRNTSSAENSYSFKAKVWIYHGPTPWHFVTLPKKLAAEIRAFHGGLQKSFGTIGVLATIGKSRWKTSVFSDTKSGSFLLPLKSGIRQKEKIAAEKIVAVTLEIA